MLELVARAHEYRDRIAIADAAGEHTYADLLAASARVASGLLGSLADLAEARIAFMTPADFSYAATQWGIWRAGGIAVPLCTQHPRPELEYVINDADATIVVAHPEHEETLRPVAEAAGRRLVLTTDALAAAPTRLPDIAESRRAMILYTSGTTGRPKGVVTTHANVKAQVTSLVSAWEWCAEDRILHVLPLHHIHGIINVLTCALWSGAACEMLPGFDATAVFQRLARGRLTLFMAVPTVYTRLIAAWEAAAAEQQAAFAAGCSRMRLMVSGSAALPTSTLRRWLEISGHVLLERYGMTEIGMGLSNPLHGERRAGYVGAPLPGVEVRLVADDGQPVRPGESGEIHVRGPGVFIEYWGRPEETVAAFRDGWFMTGDVAVVEDGAYRLLGRRSVDLIKTGGYKVSALEVEEALREHPAIAECAVVGISDPEWGERICAAIAPRAGAAPPELAALRDWCKQRIAAYKTPTRMLAVTELPRNVLGKVSKSAVAKLFAPASE